MFEVAAGSGAITTLASFNGINGQAPRAGLVEDSSGNLFGTTFYGGTGFTGLNTGDGIVFEVAAGSGGITTLVSFTGGNGQNPDAGLVEDNSGNLFGTTFAGGAHDDGSIFEVTFEPTGTGISAPSVTYNSNGLVTVTVSSPSGTPNGTLALSVDNASPITQTLVDGSSTFTLSGLDAGVHSLSAIYAAQNGFEASSQTSTLTVNPFALSFTIGSDSQTYGGPAVNLAGDLSATISTGVNGENLGISYSSIGDTDFASVGSYAITGTLVSGTGLASNYSVTLNNGTLTVTPAPLTITANNQTMVYGGTLPPLTATFTGLVNGDTPATFDASPNSAPMLATAPATSNAGAYPITVSGAVDSNYAITFANGTLTITSAPLTITAENKSMVQGGMLPALTASYVGFVNGDSPASLTTQPTLSTSASSTSGVGSYPITVSGATDTNYSISFDDGVLTINSAPTGVISGFVFQDFNLDGKQATNEPGLAGQTLFLDLNNNGVLDPGEPTASTAANGAYSFKGVPPGSYTVRQSLFGGVLLSAPAIGSYSLTITSGSGFNNQNFADGLTSITVPLTLPPSTPFPSQGNANADYVEAVYRAVLDRNADAGGLSFWAGSLTSGQSTRLQVMQGIRNSPEHFGLEIDVFYKTLLLRASDPTGRAFWVSQLENGTREEQIAFDFLDSPEYGSKGDKFFIDAMYQSLLGRTFDPKGEQKFLTALGDDANGHPTHPATLTHAQVINDFLFSEESLDRLVEGYYEVFLQRQADPGGLKGWVTELQDGLPFLTIGEQFIASDEFPFNKAAAND